MNLLSRKTKTGTNVKILQFKRWYWFSYIGWLNTNEHVQGMVIFRTIRATLAVVKKRKPVWFAVPLKQQLFITILHAKKKKIGIHDVKSWSWDEMQTIQLCITVTSMVVENNMICKSSPFLIWHMLFTFIYLY